MKVVDPANASVIKQAPFERIGWIGHSHLRLELNLLDSLQTMPAHIPMKDPLIVSQRQLRIGRRKGHSLLTRTACGSMWKPLLDMPCGITIFKLM